MNWLYLFLAGIFEIGWPLGFKLSQTTSLKAMWIIIAIISMGLSGFFLWQAQRSIPIGTAYAIWTGVVAVGTLIIGIVFFGDSASFFRLLSASLIVMGIVGLKLAS
jgi:quaternary ammonium compound-resistance protein SugE